MAGHDRPIPTVSVADRLRVSGLRLARSSPPAVRRLGRRGAVWIGDAVAPARPGAAAVERLRAPVIGPAPPVPAGTTPAELRSLLATLAIDGEPPGHLDGYATEAWLRFLHTWGLVAGRRGACLELGSNPYFLTTLLDRYTELDLQLANFFGPPYEGSLTQVVSLTEKGTTGRRSWTSALFNMEEEVFPYDDASFDVVLFCEILEHLLLDPVRVLNEIHRVLKPGGQLVLTTPNVGRRANVIALLAGTNLYDPYSGHGPYGRHNREYTPHELDGLLRFCGYTPEAIFTADSSPWEPPALDGVDEALRLVAWREPDLGQYIFSSSRADRPPRAGRPDTLYRSLPADQIVSLA